jgi:hypothetical protein
MYLKNGLLKKRVLINRRKLAKFSVKPVIEAVKRTIKEVATFNKAMVSMD